MLNRITRIHLKAASNEWESIINAEIQELEKEMN